jgi:hypothetical protein
MGKFWGSEFSREWAKNTAAGAANASTGDNRRTQKQTMHMTEGGISL